MPNSASLNPTGEKIYKLKPVPTQNRPGSVDTVQLTASALYVENASKWHPLWVPRPAYSLA